MWAVGAGSQPRPDPGTPSLGPEAQPLLAGHSQRLPREQDVQKLLRAWRCLVWTECEAGSR